MNIGARIKQLRKKLGMSADELGEKIGKNRATVYRYEKGDIEALPIDVLYPIAKCLNTTPAYLMGWEEEIKKDPVALAEKHIEILMDEEFVGLFYKYKSLDAKQRKVVINLIDSLSDTND